MHCAFLSNNYRADQYILWNATSDALSVLTVIMASFVIARVVASLKLLDLMSWGKFLVGTMDHCGRTKLLFYYWWLMSVKLGPKLLTLPVLINTN